MTKTRAYNVLGVNPKSSLSEAEQAYRDKFNKLRLQTQYGHLIPDRNKAQQQMAELKDAWECLKKHYAKMPAHTTATHQSFAQSQPVPKSQQNAAARQAWMNHFKALSINNRPLAVSFLVAASMILLVALLSKGVLGGFRAKKPASLRVFSVPWCNVKINGKSVGPSGQSEAFEVAAGTHKLTFHKGKKTFSKKVQLRPGSYACFKVQFDKEWINVD